MKVEIDPNEALPSGATFADAAVEVAGQKIADYILSEAKEGLDAEIHEARQKAIAERVVPMVVEVMEGELTLTDKYGTKKRVTTLRELVVETALTALEKPASESYRYVQSTHRWPDSDRRSLVEFFVDRYAREALETQIKSIATDVVKVTGWGEALTDNVKDALAQALADTSKRIQKNGHARI